MLTDIIQHAKSNTSGRGIFTASRYLSDVAGCLSGGACPTQVMGLSDENQWKTALEKSAETLTATDPDWGFDEKSFTTEKGYILVASGIMSTAKMDSDRDILEPKGAEIESVCPYLWHHIMMQPVGKVLSHTLSTVKSGEKELDAILFKCGIADVGNGLGRDTALLIEMGGLRNSHGFEPLEAKPMKGAGWHITKYRTFEISAVTVPANSDAVFTEYSKEKSKFRSDVVKNWIKGHYDERAKTWKGWTAPEEASAAPSTPTLSVAVDVDTSAVDAAVAKIEHLEKLANMKVETCSCKTVKQEETHELQQAIKPEKFYLPGLPGSWEAIQDSLRKSAREYIHEMRGECGCSYGYIESTFKDYVILCVWTDDGDKYYKVAWGMVNGKPSLSGEYIEVEIDFTASITESSKTAEVPETKAHENTPVTGVKMSAHSRVVDPMLASLGL